MVGHLDAGFLDETVGGIGDRFLDKLQLLDLTHQRDHDLGNHRLAGLLGDVDGGIDDGRGLHLGDFRIGNGQTAAAVTHHGVKLVQRRDDLLELVGGDVQLTGDLLDIFLLGREELVQGRIQEADGNGQSVHHLIQSLEVALLIRQDLGQCLLAGIDVLGHDHFAHGLDAVAFKEHVLGAAQADALGAEGDGLLGVAGGVGVGADLQGALGVRPSHEALEVARNGGFHGGNSLTVDVTGRAVDGDVIPFADLLTAEGEVFFILKHLDLAAAGNAAGTHAAGDNRRVGGHAAANGQNALSGRHTLDVLRGGLETDQNDLLALFGPGLGIFCGKDHTAAGSAGRSGQALADDFGSLERLDVKLRMEQGIELLGLDAHDGLVLGNHAFVHKVDGDLEGGGGGALAVTGLEHVELAVFNGKLHVLHIAVMGFELVCNGGKLLVHLGHVLFELSNGRGSTHAGNHVLSLGVDEVFAEEGLFAGGRVAGKGNASAGVFVQVTKHHGLHVDGGAPAVGDVVHAAIDVGAGVVPRTEHGLNRFHHLSLRVGGEVLALLLLVILFEELYQFLHVVGVELDVVLDALFLFEFVDDDLKLLLGDLHDDVGEHLDETAIRIVNKTLKFGVGIALDQAGGNLVVQAEVEDGVHHAGHGSARARTDRNEKGLVGIAELLAVDLFDLGQIFVDLGLNFGGNLSSVLIIPGAGLGGHRESLRNRHAELYHLGQVRALAAQQLPHGLVAL